MLHEEDSPSSTPPYRLGGSAESRLDRIDDEMDSDGYVHGCEEAGLGQDLNISYIEANLV